MVTMLIIIELNMYCSCATFYIVEQFVKLFASLYYAFYGVVSIAIYSQANCLMFLLQLSKRYLKVQPVFENTGKIITDGGSSTQVM